MQQSAFKQQQYNQFEVRKSQYNVHWKTDLIGACCAAPCSCLIALVCPPCFSYYVRKRVLYNDLNRYVCCNGDCPCSGRMSEQSCPEVCLALEVCFCFAQSVASSRWAIQDEQHIRNTACDNWCEWGFITPSGACLSGSSELGAIADVADSIAHFLWVTVCGCMQTQAKVQLDERDKNPGVVRQPFNPLQAPQQQSIPMGQQPGGYPPQQGGYPPQQGGYPPQQGGYPQQGPPPQQYPPQGYPQGYPGAPQGYPGAQKMSR